MTNDPAGLDASGPATEPALASSIRWTERTEQVVFAVPSVDQFHNWLRLADPSQAAATVCAAGLQPLVLLESACRHAVLEHLQAHDIEAGGLLLGKVWRRIDGEPDRPATIQVTHSLPALAEGTAVSIRMDPGVWTEANRLCEDRGLTIVGWYHSHPNLGAFFSGTDRRTQSRFFRHAYSLGLVIDPVSGDEKWFLGPRSEALLYPVVALMSAG